MQSMHAEHACRHDSVRCSIGCSGNLVKLIPTFLPLLLYIPPPSPSFFTFHLPFLLLLCSTSLSFFYYVPPPSSSFFTFHLPPLLSLCFTSLPCWVTRALGDEHQINSNNWLCDRSLADSRKSNRELQSGVIWATYELPETQIIHMFHVWSETGLIHFFLVYLAICTVELDL